jgi:hypothetical protein
MRGLMRHSLLLGGLFGLLVGCGEMGGGSSISGMVTAPAGGDVAGTEVVACFVNEPGCARLSVEIETSGTTGSYKIDNLPNGSYGVIALKDANDDGDSSDAGDYYGSYADASGQAVLVTPPASGIDIQLLLLTDAAQDIPEAVRELSARTD